MSVLGTVTDLMNQSALMGAGVNRNPGGEMGKNDFLLLLSAQLRYQDPLEPKNDSDFAAGLAQFSALEQMQNMNTSLDTMASHQTYTLVGKYVIAETLIDGRVTEIPGVVDSIHFANGVAMAQIGEFVVPVSSIKEVFDTSNILTSEMLLTASNNLIGRAIVAEVDGEDIEGIVTRILVDRGSLFAQVDDGTGEPKFVPVNAIVDVREAGTERHTPKFPKPEVPPDAKNWVRSGDDFIEVDDKGAHLGLWTWDEEKWLWTFESFLEDDNAA